MFIHGVNRRKGEKSIREQQHSAEPFSEVMMKVNTQRIVPHKRATRPVIELWAVKETAIPVRSPETIFMCGFRDFRGPSAQSTHLMKVPHFFALDAVIRYSFSLSVVFLDCKSVSFEQRCDLLGAPEDGSLLQGRTGSEFCLCHCGKLDARCGVYHGF
jgi:hypothetical protein